MDVKEAPGRPLEYGETFPAGALGKRGAGNKLVAFNVHGTSALTFATAGATFLGFSSFVSAFAGVAEATEAGGRP